MKIEILTALGLLLPLAGTALGAAMALALRRADPLRQRLMLGFAAGVMLAASVWSLLLPAIESAEAAGRCAALPAAGGFLLGVGAMALLRRAVERRSHGSRADRQTLLLACSVTLHNIPEGMAVGVAFAPALAGNAPAAGAMALAVGIAVQNIPEGGVISLPLAFGGEKRRRAFAAGVLSGAVEPLAGALALGLTAWLRPLLPWVLALAAGCMFFVVTAELLRAPDEEACLSAGAAAVGFALMMLLDVALG